MPLKDEPDKRPEKAMDAVHLLQKAYARYRYRLWRCTEVPKRTWMTAGLTFILFLLFFILSGLPVFKNLENFLIDLRFRALPLHPPAESIILVSIDESTLQADPTLLVNKADEMGILLQRVLEAGAQGVAFDFLLPESWGRSESFAKLILNNQEKFVLASFIKEDGSLLGTECLKGLIMAALGSKEDAAKLFGFLNMLPDPDGRIRRARPGFKDQEGQVILSMPSRAYRLLTRKDLTSKQMEQPLWIDYSTDWTKFKRISYGELPDVLSQKPDSFRQKMVLVGGEYEGSQDFHRIPKRPGFADEISGLLVQALALNTLLQGRPIHEVQGLLAFLPAALLFVIFAIIFLTRRRVLSSAIVLIDLLFKLKEKDPSQGYIEESFHAAERAKSRAFLELLAETKVDLASGISQEMGKEEINFQRQLTAIQQQLLDPEVKDKESLYKELQSVESRYSDFVNELRKKNPHYASAVHPEPYSLNQAQSQLLDKNTYLIEFFVGEANAFLWVISKDKVIWVQSFPSEHEIFRKVSDFQTQIAQRKINLDFGLGKEIYDVLLRDALKHIPLSSHLIIIPDGLLLRFPFEALAVEVEGKTPKYLLEYYTVSYAPSASVLGEVMAQERPAVARPADVLALGNPVIEGEGKTGQASVEYLRASARLLPLPYTEEEVFSISEIYKKIGKTAESYVREEALEEVVKSGRSGQFKNLHFATHGFIDDRVPALSGLLLAPGSTPEGEDGFLRLNEIFHLKLNAEMVTLSACETALGKEVRGEGMIGLTRAFFYAGARSVMASLWMVSDQSTAILMKDFYSHYIKGERPSAALRQAKINLLKGDEPLYRHPFFWAPFVIMGSH